EPHAPRRRGVPGACTPRAGAYVGPGVPARAGERGARAPAPRRDPRRRCRSGSLVDRDVRLAARPELVAPPAAPALAQPQPGETGHQVELGRVRVAKSDRPQLGAACAYRGQLDVNPLRDRVVAGQVEVDAVAFDLQHRDALVAL